jgi:hypothetical protein
MKDIRAYFEIVSDEPTRFQQIFVEHTIPMGSGSVTEFEDPMASLGLNSPSVSQTSTTSSVAGRRAEVLCLDDLLSDKNSNTEKAADNVVAIYARIQKLRSATGMTVLAGTPWFPNDLYARLIASADAAVDANEEPPLVYRIDPAYRIKPESKYKVPRFPQGLEMLTEDDVILAHPNYLTWKMLERERKRNASEFASQNLIEWPTAEGEGLRITFGEDEMRKHFVGRDYFSGVPVRERVCSLDWATSTARYADGSALIFADILQKGDKHIAFVQDVIYGKWKISELGEEIVKQLIANGGTSRMIAEKAGPWESLQDAMKRAAFKYNFNLPYIYWQGNISGGTNKDAKARRIKGLETLLASDQLFFRTFPNMDVVMAQFTAFDGSPVKRSNSVRKEDIPDATALLVGKFLPRPANAERRSPEEDMKSQQEREAEVIESQRREQHKAIFCGGNERQQQPLSILPEPLRNSSAFAAYSTRMKGRLK